MKFLADMDIAPQTALYLQYLGHDATHLYDQGLGHLPCTAVLAKAYQEGRVLITHDLDFVRLIAPRGCHLPSVILMHLRNMHPDQVNRYLQEAIDHYAAELEQGAILSVIEDQMRVRPLTR